jgi:4-hydroxybenzoate polyprenyltransferase
MSRARPHHWLALVPTVLVCAGVPFANRARPFILGLPFLLFWLLACVLATSVVMAMVHTLDRRADAAERRREPGA